jgi:DNA polymerase III subunit beta
MITVDRKVLLESLKVMSLVTNNRSTLPILTHTHAHQNGSLTLTATDLEVGMRLTVPSAGDAVETFTLETKAVMSYLKQSKAKQVVLSPDYEPEAERFRTLINDSVELCAMDPQDFPVWSDPKDDGEIMSIKSFMDDIDKIIYASSTDESRFNLNGVCITKDYLTATDGHRLAIIKNEHYPINEEPYWKDLPDHRLKGQTLLPRRSLIVVQKAIKSIKGVTLAIVHDSLRAVWFEGGNFSFSIRKIDGDFPPKEKIIPNRFSINIHVSKTEFRDKLSAHRAVTSERNRGVTIDFADYKLLHIRSANGDGKSCHTMVGVEKMEYPNPDDWTVEPNIIVGAEYMLEGVEKIPGDALVIQLTEDEKPVVFCEPQHADLPWEERPYMHLMMPMYR